MSRIFTRWRWGLFVGGTVFGLVIWFSQVQEDPGHAFLYGLILMTAAFVLVSTDIARLLASPFLNFIDSIYLSGGGKGKARLSYDLPIYYERHFRGEEAIDAYEALIAADPNQINAYAGAIRVCENLLEDRARARRWRTIAERRFGRSKVAGAVAKTAAEWHAERMVAAVAPAPSQ